MKNKGCAFEIKGGGSCRYYTSPAVTGLADFARFLYENRASAAGVPLPVRKRIPQAEEISETAWHEIADGYLLCSPVQSWADITKEKGSETGFFRR